MGSSVVDVLCELEPNWFKSSKFRTKWWMNKFSFEIEVCDGIEEVYGKIDSWKTISL